MTARSWRWLVLPLLLYATLFPVLSLDVVVRLVHAGAARDLALVLFYELTRAARSILALALVGLLMWKAAERRYTGVLVLFLLFGLIAFAMASEVAGYVGRFQEWLTRWLLGMGASRQMLRLMFGYPDWALWLALAAWIRFSLLFPQPLTVAAVEGSGVHDRDGWFRRVPAAGADVGSLARRALAGALQRGWLGAVPMWIVAGIAAVLSITLRDYSWRWLLWLPFGLGAALALTALRATYVAGAADAQSRLRWVARGAAAAAVLFALAGVAGLSGSNAAAIAIFVLLTLAPAAFLIGLAIAVLPRSAAEREG